MIICGGYPNSKDKDRLWSNTSILDGWNVFRTKETKMDHYLNLAELQTSAYLPARIIYPTIPCGLFGLFRTKITSPDPFAYLSNYP
ncbi:hypothetical protein AYI68_g3590 [Smittium mucronatum]|uniref:Uncharacterized protein n=1 Tax=Smittium mucronatum TaxID=133383 RepID=A0A1R0GZE9_9FUNG|nr:hypothetical protein AYI68_g3590 [Smittium mucronatum]